MKRKINIFKIDYLDGYKTTFDTRDAVHGDGLIGYFLDSVFPTISTLVKYRHIAPSEPTFVSRYDD